MCGTLLSEFVFKGRKEEFPPISVRSVELTRPQYRCPGVKSLHVFKAHVERVLLPEGQDFAFSQTLWAACGPGGLR